MPLDEARPLSRGQLVCYGLGGLGWASASNMVGLLLVFFYIPPTSTDSCGTMVAGGNSSSSSSSSSNGSNSSSVDEPLFPIYVPQVTFATILNTIVLLAAAGRLWDAVTDPCIASFSDRLRWQRGRRIPMLAAGALPTALFSALLFFPIVPHESGWNVVWLALIQLLFYLSLTCYCTPFFACVPEFGHTEAQRLDLAVACSISFALGGVLATSTSSLGRLLNSDVTPVASLQFGVVVVSTINALLMIAPVMAIDERKHAQAPSESASLFVGMRICLANRYFRAYVMADLAFFYASAMIQTALPFYLNVLLCAPDLLTPVVAALVGISLLWYYPVAVLARRLGKKRLVLSAMLVLALVFVGVAFAGAPLAPIPTALQLFGGVAVISVPLSALGMLPNACLADIVVHDALSSGQSNEGMFFAARTFLQKIGTTLGIMTFASLTNAGNSAGVAFQDDLGVRLSGPACAAFFLIAMLAFSFYDEKTLQRETREMEAQARAKADTMPSGAIEAEPPVAATAITAAVTAT